MANKLDPSVNYAIILQYNQKNAGNSSLVICDDYVDSILQARKGALINYSIFRYPSVPDTLNISSMISSAKPVLRYSITSNASGWKETMHPKSRNDDHI